MIYEKNEKVSIIFQDFHLIPWLSINNNIRLYDYFHKSSYILDETLTKQFKNTSVNDLPRTKTTYCDRACTLL